MRIRQLALCGVVASILLTADRRVLVLEHEPGHQQPTFRSGTALVEVDAVVLDKDGNFVPGLKAEDLRIFEDGKEQRIQHFYMVTYNSVSGVPTRYDDQADYRARRIFVMLFDEGHLAVESMLRAKRGAEDFIRDQMSQGDMGGVFVGGGMYKGRLTTDKGELLAAVRTASPMVDNRQSILAPFREFPRIPSETDAMRIADGAREVTHELGVKACEEEPQECTVPGGLQQIENAIQNKSRLYVRQARILISTTVRNLQTIARGMSRIWPKNRRLHHRGLFRRRVAQHSSAGRRRGGASGDHDLLARLERTHQQLESQPGRRAPRAREVDSFRHRRGWPQHPDRGNGRLYGAEHRRHVPRVRLDRARHEHILRHRLSAGKQHDGR